MPSLEAIVHFSNERPRSAPWLLLEEAHGDVRLSTASTEREIGSAVEEILNYSGIDLNQPVPAIFAELARTATVVVGGGLRVVDGDLEIRPECCSGLERWREWESVPAGNNLPWMGHDQAVWVERTADGYRVCANENDDYDADPTTSIEFTESEMQSALKSVQRDLLGFLVRLREWATAVAPNEADALVAAIDRAFEITAPRSQSGG